MEIEETVVRSLWTRRLHFRSQVRLRFGSVIGRCLISERNG